MREQRQVLEHHADATQVRGLRIGHDAVDGDGAGLDGGQPAIARSVVVLPQPEGPSRQTNSPGAIASVTPCTTRSLP